MLRGALIAAILIAVLGAAGFWFLTGPERLDPELIAQAAEGDAAAGERIFNAAGCASCHARPRAEGEARLELAGGLALDTPFGSFVAPNISTHRRDGIGGWTFAQFANAVMRGVSPDGRHYYPAFPYASYARMRIEDVADLFAYMRALPAVEGRAADHDLGFPYTVRRGIGLWKRLHLDAGPVIALGEDASELVAAGRYLVEGPGHCGECHTPRDITGGLEQAKWLSGATAAEGDGNVPNITSGEGGIGDWSQDDIVAYLESGFTPDFDTVGGAMVAVQRNMARLPPEDREAIAAYLKAVPPLPNGYAAGE